MNLRIIAAGMMFVSALVCATLLLGEQLSPSQQKASQNCDKKFLDDVARCLREHPQLSPQDCNKAAYAGYQVCRQKAGLPKQEPPRSPKGPNDRPSGNKPTISQPTATPGKGVRDTTRLNGAATTALTATPTPTPRPKPPLSPVGEKKN